MSWRHRKNKTVLVILLTLRAHKNTRRKWNPMGKYFNTWWKVVAWLILAAECYYACYLNASEMAELNIHFWQAVVGWVVQYYVWWFGIRAIHAIFIYAIFAKEWRFSMVRILHSSTGKIARNWWVDFFRINKHEMRIIQKMCLLLAFIN